VLRPPCVALRCFFGLRGRWVSKRPKLGSGPRTGSELNGTAVELVATHREFVSDKYSKLSIYQGASRVRATHAERGCTRLSSLAQQQVVVCSPACSPACSLLRHRCSNTEISITRVYLAQFAWVIRCAASLDHAVACGCWWRRKHCCSPSVRTHERQAI